MVFSLYGSVRDQLEYELSQSPEDSIQSVLNKYIKIGMDAVPPEGAIRFAMERAFQETRKYFLGRAHLFFQELGQNAFETQIQMNEHHTDYMGRLDE